MEQKVKIKKHNKEENLEQFTKEELISKIKSLTAHNIQLKNLLAKQTSPEKIAKQSKAFDFSKYQFQHVFLHLLYLGWDYKGFVVQEDTTDTVEHHLFEALMKTKLIQDRTSSNYHRCGRTDKGVSSFGQVISIDLRTNMLKNDQKELLEDSNKSKNQLNYCKILNKVLPSNIQCVGWSLVGESSSARFDCLSRTYKYYFPKGKLNIQKMRFASEKLLGTHDFRNLCKMDVGNGVVDFKRNITEMKIEPIDKQQNLYAMYVITIKAKAFLWHQIRCIMGILFLMGQENEEPEVIDELFNIEKYPRKPEYSMGSEIPLNLHYCEYENLNWNYDTQILDEITEKLNHFWTFYAVKKEMVRDMIKAIENIKISKKLPVVETKCLSEHLVQHLKTKNYVPLLKRQTCDSLEDKIEHYMKRKRIELIDENK
ncbi:tRNA pseudouridine(38/39) synthase isoform X2 [Diorhabda carinulata]|uniref:tRNA pseudouridine(38/39) synthase isoform X2 n=1 Tax=Diorhabda carinulata TaxID=1163345 RepID=UPI0025A0A37F|nr:tRNA pseudouridine(38/39) synthase isoform X2 [Diorhabda carinulata]